MSTLSWTLCRQLELSYYSSVTSVQPFGLDFAEQDPRCFPPAVALTKAC